MKMVLTMLLKTYDMELIDEPRPNSGPLTYWPASPTRVRYRKRSETALSESELFAREHRDESAAAPPAECPFHVE